MSAHGEPSPDAGALRAMHKRYMFNATVSRWLLHKQQPPGTRPREHALRLNLTPTDPAARPAFPAADDLYVVDQVHDGFALGQIRGDPSTAAHPYSALAALAGQSGWRHVRARHFASDQTSRDALELVEYARFADNSLIVVLTRLLHGAPPQDARLSEVLFYAAPAAADGPPPHPRLVLLAADASSCSACARRVCACPDSLTLPRGSLKDLVPSGAAGAPAGMPFIQRMRIMHGERSGVLNLDFAPSPDPAFKPCTLRYPYVSACVRLDADADRSRHQLAPTALCDMPPTPQEASPPVPALAAMDPTAEPAAFAPSDDPAIAFGPEFSHSPVSFTTVPSNVTSIFKDPGLLPTRKTGLQKPDNVFPQNPCIEGNVACFPNPLQQQQQQHPQPQGKTATTVPPDCVPPKRQQESLSASVVSLATLQSNVDPFPSDPKIPNSLCGPDKRGRECECSAENMPDPSLALILNSRNDRHQLIDIGPSAEPVLKPAIRQNGNVRDVVLPSAPRNPNDSGDAILESDESTALGSLGSHLRFGSQGQEGNRLGASTTLPSQSRFPGLMPGEPPMKRPRSDTTQRPAPLNLSSMDQPWSSFDDHRTIPMPSWNMAVAADRPQSALARAFGMTRSPSPAGLMSGTPYVPSPPTAPLSTANFGFPQAITHQDHFMQGASFDSSVLGREADIVNQQRMQANDGVEERRDQHQKREQHHLVGDSPNTNDGTGANTNEQSVANGVQCEVCGLSFAKRSNKSRHVQTVHDGLKQFECDLCGQKFAHKADLGRHRYRIHVSRAFSCEKCGKSFAEQDQLHHHVRVTHEEDARPWECKQCQIRFGRKSSLTRHRQTVHQKTRFTCRVCSKTYSQKFDAVRHERKAHGVSCTSASASASAS